MSKPEKIRHSLPKTGFDMAVSTMPALMREAVDLAASTTPDPEFATDLETLPRASYSSMAKAIDNMIAQQDRLNGLRYRRSYGSEEASGYSVIVGWTFWQMTNFLLHGSQTFFVHENIVPLLATTHINVDAENFTLPAPVCMFVYDGPNARLIAHAMQPDDPLANKDVAISVTLMRMRSRLPDAVADIWILGEQVSAAGERFIWKRMVPLRRGTTLDQSLRRPYSDEEWTGGDPEELAKMYGEPGYQNPVDEYHSDFQDKDFDFIRMVMNTALYLGSNGADLSGRVVAPRKDQFATLPRSQRIRLEAAAADSSRLSYVYVGRNAEPVEIEREEIDGGVDGEGRKLTKRFKVKAHQRWQRVGPGRSEIRLTDVKAHMKGPESAEVLHRRTVLKLHPDAVIKDVPTRDDDAPGA